MTTAPTLPAAVVIELWNRVAEGTGTLEETLCRFAGLLLRAAGQELNQHANNHRQD
ncbi:MAG: hypothetical protein ACRD1A_01890 [Terriglobales bacterium]